MKKKKKKKKVSGKQFEILPQLLGCYRWHEMKVGKLEPVGTGPAVCRAVRL